MLAVRVIPALLLRNGGLVKTERFKKHKYIGDPINAVRIFNEKEVDELIFVDIDASKNRAEPQWEVLQDLSSECFMPLAYGGGIKTLAHIEKLLKIGIEKVLINSEAIENPNFIREAVAQFGSSTIIGGVDVKKNLFGKYRVFNHVAGTSVSVLPQEHAVRLQEYGVGEIFLCNVDREGTYLGYDVPLIESVTVSVEVPVIACGGAGALADFGKATEAGASAVAAGSLFVYHGPHRAVLISYPSKEALSF